MAQMKKLPKVDLPREKLAKYGTDKLSDKELLAIILGSGIEGLNVLELSQKILERVKKIGIEKITLEELLKIKGLGQAKASQIVACLELGKRLTQTEKVEILSPKDIWMQCADFRESKKEHFVAFYLDTRNNILTREVVSIGTVNMSIVHPREVFEPALKCSATSIVLAHNHPSGVLEPSEDDLQITKRLVEAGELLGIQVSDHIIVTTKAYMSLRKAKKL